MDGQWPQQNSGIHTDLDLAIGSPTEYCQILQELGDDLDGMLALGPDTNMGNTGGAGAAAADQGNKGGETVARPRFNRKRHDREQINELEAAFRENPHPDENHRRDLGRRVGMSEAQVKFWFQNRCSSKKTHDQRQVFRDLQDVNEALQAEHRALREAAENNRCLDCVADGNGTRQQLLAENKRLKEELQRLKAILKRVTGGRGEAAPNASHFPATNPINVRRRGNAALAAADHAPPPPSHRAVINYPMLMPANEGLVRRQRDTETMLVDIANRALTEFFTVVSAGTSMWLQTPDGEVLNIHKYTETMFPSIFGPYWMGSVVDGTRRTGDVPCTANNLVGILMDAASWSEMFPGIVASATASRISTHGASQHGIIQLMDAELRVLSPRVSVRKLKFVRHCQQLEAGKWAVVDVSVDGILGQDGGVPSTCRLLPSGCLIEVQKNSYCKVTWMVNMEYDQTSVSPLYHPLLRSGQALGACRWLGSLQRQCEYLVILHSSRIPAALGDTTDLSPDGRKNLMGVAQRMTRSFYEAMCGPGAQPWISVNRWRGGCGTGLERFEVEAQVVTYSAVSGAPGSSVVLSATATVWLPGVPAQQVFNYLCNEGRRGEWDILANGAPMIQEGKFTTGQLPGNAVTVLRTIESNGTNGGLILQEARTDPSCMVLAYATLNNESMQRAVGTGGLATLSLLPSGLIILPDGHSGPVAPPTSAACSSSTAVGHRSNTGSFVSTMYQTLLNDLPPQRPSLEAIDNAGNQLCRVIRKIKDAVDASRVVDA